MGTAWRRAFVGVISLVLIISTFGFSATSAHADHGWPVNKNVRLEQDYAVLLVSAPDTSGMTCRWFVHSEACYEEYGDIWYVHDLTADGRSAVAVWEDYSSCDTSTCVMWRQGTCRNHHGVDTWARCNKNYYETHWIAFGTGVSEGWHVVNYDTRFIWLIA